MAVLVILYGSETWVMSQTDEFIVDPGSGNASFLGQLQDTPEWKKIVMSKYHTS